MDAQPFFQALRHGAGQGAHLMDVVNLAIQHGAAVVLRRLDVQGLEPAAGGPAHNAHDAAGADIQGKDQVLLLGS